MPLHEPARSGMLDLPGRISEAREASLLARVGKTQVCRAGEVGQQVVYLGDQLGRRLVHALAELANDVRNYVRACGRSSIHKTAGALLHWFH